MMDSNCPIFAEDDVNTAKDFLSAKREYDRVNFTIKLNRAKRRLKDKEQAISDLQNEYELLEKQAFELYKHEISYFGFDYVPDIEAAQDWLNKLTAEKIDKRKNYPEKEAYNNLNSRLSELLGTNLTVTSIVECNWGDAFEFEFNFNDNTYRFEVPIVAHISLKSYQQEKEYVFEARLTKRVGDSSWNTIHSGLYLEDFQDYFYFKNRENS